MSDLMNCYLKHRIQQNITIVVDTLIVFSNVSLLFWDSTIGSDSNCGNGSNCGSGSNFGSGIGSIGDISNDSG